MSRMLLAAVALSLFTGCHGRFKRAAPDIQAVRAQVISDHGPSVNLGGGQSDFAPIIGIVQGVNAVEIERKLNRSVNPDQMNAAFQEGLATGLAGGPPFRLTDREKAPLLQVEVVDYGIEVPELGVQGVFNYDLKVRLYDRDGRRVYKTRVSCESPVGDPKGISRALGTVNNAKQVDEMRRKEIQAAFDEAAWMCGSELVTKMRKHASPGLGSDLRAAMNDVDRTWQ